MGIDTSIPGSPAAVVALADWLAKLRIEVDDCKAASESAHNSCLYVWRGLSGEGFQDFSTDLTGATDEISTRLYHIEDKIRAFAQQLGWRQDDMAVHRETANSHGLPLDGFIINPPATVSEPVTQMTQPGSPGEAKAQAEVAAYTAYTDQLVVYDKSASEVRATFDQLDNWITDNLVQMETDTLSPPGISDLLGAAADIGGGLTENAFTKTADLLRSRIPAATEALARLRSGNPVVRSGAKTPRDIALVKAMTPSELAKWGGYFDDAAKWASHTGTFVGIGLSAFDLSQGASPSSVAVGFGAGFGAGIAISALMAGAVVSAPVLTTVAVSAFASAGIAWGATAAYENLVPQVTRDQIDESIRDSWNARSGNLIPL
jgi:hypothetical protein